MPCYDPRDAIANGTTRAGKIAWKFANWQESKFTQLFPDCFTRIGCGQCTGCRSRKQRDIAVRASHEATLHERNSFVTVTYRDEKLPFDGNLVRKDVVDFIKRLRYFIADRHNEKIRVMYCGEYGERFKRPHYHLVVFGFDFHRDRYEWAKRKRFKYYRSPLLEEAWTDGNCEISSVSFDTMAYVAGYVHKKRNGHQALSHYEYLDEYGEYQQRAKEFGVYHGIGREWIDRYPGDVYPKGFVHIGGKEFAPPRYYDRRFEIAYPSDFATLKAQRRSQIRALASDNTFERLKVKERVAELNLQRKERPFEL